MPVSKFVLPRFMVLQVDKLYCVKYVSDREVICEQDGSLFDILAKIEVEPAKTNDDYFHLRFCHNNKYWARGQYGDDGRLVADSTKPEEDTSKPSCTLFRIKLENKETILSIKHVQSGGYVAPLETGSEIFVYDEAVDDYPHFTVVNSENIVNLPKHVAFKGDNGKYLMAVWTEGHPYLQFSSDDPNQEESGHEVSLLPNGNIRIKSAYLGKFWRRSPEWIWGDADADGDSSNLETHFRPVKEDNNTIISLEAQVNKKFCARLTTERKIDCLNASASTTNQYAKFEVQELVQRRKIYGIKYRTKDARIYNQNPYLAGTATATNPGNEEASIAVEITYEDERSYSFGRSLSITAGVNTTIEANVLGITRGAVEISYSVTGTFEWNTTTTTKRVVKATGSVRVPARTTGLVRYTGSVGTCSIPFSYKQQDKSSTDGTVVVTDEVDGVFTGVNYFDFSFEFDGAKAL